MIRFCICLAFAVEVWAAPAARAGAERYGGIEIGSKGVKAVAIEVAGEAQRGTVKTLVTRSANPTVGALDDGRFDATAIEETAAVAGKLLALLRDEYRVPADHVFLVGSSFVAGVSNREELARAIKAKTGRDLAYVTDEEEPIYTFQGVVPPSDQPAAILVDVGSGNTKGAAVGEAGSGFRSFSLPLGTVSYTTRVAQHLKGASEVEEGDFVRAAKAIAPEALAGPLGARMDRGGDLRGKSPVYLTGGIVWAMTTLLYPEKLDEPLVPLAGADIERFRRLLERDPGGFPAADLARIEDPTLRRQAEAELRRVRGVFTTRNLVAGAEILHALAVELRLEGKPLYFGRNGQYAWILAKIAPRADRRDEETKPHPEPKPVTPAAFQVPGSPPVPRKTMPEPVGSAG